VIDLKKVVLWFKNIFEWCKKYWYVIVGVLIGLLALKGRSKGSIKTDLEKLKQKKEEQLRKDEEELEKLKKEAEKIEKTDKFSNPDDAVDFLNDRIRKLQDNSKK
jgi:uncharacterized membrane-anchored protein YhcB (DUF1043 family)